LECASSISECVGISVGESGKGRNFFATLSKIPMNNILSVWASVIVAKCHNVFATLSKIPTGNNPSVNILQVLFLLPVYPPA
jgi:hypothetical protein